MRAEVGAFGGDEAAKGVAGAGDTALHGAEVDVEEGGDLAVAECVAEGEDRAGIFVELSHAPGNEGGKFVDDRLAGGTGGATG